MTYDVVKTIFIAAPPETVWDYLIDKDKLGLWFHRAKESLVAEKDYALMSSNNPDEVLLGGRVIEFMPPHSLVVTFTHKWMDYVETIVSWDLFAVEGGTRLHLTHSGFEKTTQPFKLAQDHDEGWDEHLTKLRNIET